MATPEARLENCFDAVFADLELGDLRKASVASVPEWDSLATITLMALIEEEFGITISTDDLELFVSFKVINELIGGRLAVT